MNKTVQLKNGADNLFPVIDNSGASSYTDAQCFDAFVSKMNTISSEIGMSGTTWINPSGLRSTSNTYSHSTVRDMARMVVEALSYDWICRVWNKPSYAVRVKNKNDINVTTSVSKAALENYYPIIGGKTGGGDGYLALVCVTKIGEDFVAGAIAEVSSGNADDRFQAMKELFDCAADALQGNTPSGVTTANCACAYKIPKVNTATIEDKTVLTELYVKNGDKSTVPMSTTKVMTMITALRYVTNIYQPVTITEKDVENTTSTSGAIFSVGDVVTFHDLMYACLLPSSNQAANAIARVAGKYILDEINFI